MDLDVAIKGILSVRQRIAKAWELPTKLSDLGNKLAQYNAYIGDYLGDYEKDREMQRGAMYLEHLGEGDSPTAAENRVRAEIAELTGNIRKLQLLHKDAETQMSMIQTRIRVLESMKRGEY